MDPEIESFHETFSSTFWNEIESKQAQQETAVVLYQYWQLVTDSKGSLRYGEVINSQRKYYISKKCEWTGQVLVTQVGKLPLIKAPDMGCELGKLFKSQSMRGLVPTAQSIHDICQTKCNGITLKDVVMAVEIWKDLGLRRKLCLLKWSRNE